MTGSRANVETVCVYCGSSAGKNHAFAEAARRLGESFAAAGTRLVYGGGDLGLMFFGGVEGHGFHPGCFAAL